MCMKPEPGPWWFLYSLRSHPDVRHKSTDYATRTQAEDQLAAARLTGLIVWAEIGAGPWMEMVE